MKVFILVNNVSPWPFLRCAFQQSPENIMEYNGDVYFFYIKREKKKRRKITFLCLSLLYCLFRDFRPGFPTRQEEK